MEVQRDRAARFTWFGFVTRSPMKFSITTGIARPIPPVPEPVTPARPPTVTTDATIGLLNAFTSRPHRVAYAGTNLYDRTEAYDRCGIEQGGYTPHSTIAHHLPEALKIEALEEQDNCCQNTN